MERIDRRIAAFVIGVVLAASPLTTVLAGGAWPQRPVHVIVQVGAGSGVDLTARLYAERLAQRWKQPVIVENRTGADGLIATAAFAAMRDDHVLLFSPAAPISVFPYIYGRLAYDRARDIVPIARAADTFPAVATTAALSIKSIDELVAYAHTHPGQLNYRTSAGAFTPLMADFLNRNHVDMVQVSYREDLLAVQDLAKGRIQVNLSLASTLLPQVQAGNVRFLAVTNNARAPLAPEIPTAAEAGHPELAFEGLLGFFGTRDMSAALRNRISADVRAVAADPAFADRLTPMWEFAHGSTPAEFAAAIEEQRAKMETIAKALGTQPAD